MKIFQIIIVITFIFIFDGSQSVAQIHLSKKKPLQNETIKSDTLDPPDYFPVDKPPVPLVKISPRYPFNLPGIHPGHNMVWVKMLVGKDGNVRKVVIMKSDDAILNNYAVAAAKQWEFAPAILNNRAVECWFTQYFVFRTYR